MKTQLKTLIMAVSITAIFGCTAGETTEHHWPVQKERTVQKVLKKKAESVETDYHYKMDWWNGKLRQQPRVSTVYHFLYTDSKTERVSMDTYALYEPGDTITITETYWE